MHVHAPPPLSLSLSLSLSFFLSFFLSLSLSHGIVDSLSPLSSPYIQTKTLQKFIGAEVKFEAESVRFHLETLLRDKTAGSYSSLALQDLTTIIDHLRAFGAKETVSEPIHDVDNPSYMAVCVAL